MLKDWIQAPDLETFRSADPRQIVADALTGIERYALPDFVREDYLSSYEGDRFVESMRYVHTYPTDFPVLRLLLPETQTPVQTVVGERDALVLPVNVDFLQERLPKKQARHHRRGALHLGGRHGRVRGVRKDLMGRRLRDRRICGSVLICSACRGSRGSRNPRRLTCGPGLAQRHCSYESLSNLSLTLTGRWST